MAEETIQRVLKQYYGHTAFRPGQEELIQGILAGRDCSGRHAHRRGQVFVLSDPRPAAAGAHPGGLPARSP